MYGRQELETSNPKVKKEALAVMSTMYAQIGPKIRALSISIAKTAETKTTLETCFNSSTFDASSVPTDWNRRYMFDADQVDGARQAGGAIDLEVPRTDIFSLLTPDIIAKLVSNIRKVIYVLHQAVLTLLPSIEFKRRKSCLETSQGGTGCIRSSGIWMYISY